jgi:hypothetical protein
MSNRGYQVQHQRVVVHVDPLIRGTVIITVQPLNPSLRTIYLDCLVNVEGVTLSSTTSDQPLLDTPASWCVAKTKRREGSLERHPELKRKVWAEDGNELAISVSGGWIRLLEGHQKLAPIDIRIDYTAGQGYLGVDWMPCVDDLWMRNTWELQYIVPNEWLVASSGELVEQVRRNAGGANIDSPSAPVGQDHLLILADGSHFGTTYWICCRAFHRHANPPKNHRIQRSRYRL